MNDGHSEDNIDDVAEFYAAIDRQHLTKALSKTRPYTYWTIELYDKANGIRGGGGLGVLAADTRRVAERMNVLKDKHVSVQDTTFPAAVDGTVDLGAITITAYACQAQGFDDAAAAWADCFA